MNSSDARGGLSAIGEIVERERVRLGLPATETETEGGYVFVEQPPARERLRGDLGAVPYDAYLASAQWQAKRRKALRRADYRCQICNSDTGLQVHHRTYEQRGRERIKDLTVLCNDCHELVHEHVEIQ